MARASTKGKREISTDLPGTVNALPVVMTIQTIGKNGDWHDVSTARLMRATGADPDGTVEDLFYHVTECYPAQDWRLMDGATEIDVFDALLSN